MQTVQQALRQHKVQQIFILLKEYYPSISPQLQQQMIRTFLILLGSKIEPNQHQITFINEQTFLEDQKTPLRTQSIPFILGCKVNKLTLSQAAIIVREMFAQRLRKVGLT